MCHGRDDRLEQVRVVVRELALHDCRDPLQSHAGVDARRRQGRELARGVALVLHEDQVPHLEPAVALALDTQARPPRLDLGAGEGVALVEVDLRAGPAGTRLAHGPEVLLGPQLEDAVLAQVSPPEAVGVGIARDPALALEDGDGEAVLGQPHVLGQELPGEGDGLLLEVVAEGEVAQHLEEGVVARGPAHVLQVVVLAPRAHALLGGGRARVVALLLAQEDVLELVHARVGEEEGGVALGDEGRAADHAVAALLEVAQERAADLVGRLRPVRHVRPNPP